MYIIINVETNQTVGATSNPKYITYHDDPGCYVLTDEETARGVAYAGVPYSLLGREPLPNDNPVVIVTQRDDGPILFQNETAMADTDELLIDHEFRIMMLELGL